MKVIELSDIDNTILPWLGRTAKAMDYFLADYFDAKGLNLTKAQMIVLRILSQNDGIVQNKLAFITNRDKASLTRLIETMEKKELVKRSTSTKDKRVKIVHITDSGIALLENARPYLKEIINKVQENVSEQDLLTTIKVLKQISKNINADELTAPLK